MTISQDFDDNLDKSRSAVDFDEILKTDNIATILNDEQTAFVTLNVNEQFNIDKQSREEKQKIIVKILSLFLANSKEKSFPWPGASNVIFPLIPTACIEFAAKCYPEIFKDGAIAKGKVIGNDMGLPDYDQKGRPIVDPETGESILYNAGEKLKKANRVAEYLNWQLKCEITNFEEDSDTLFNSLPAIGTLFKKVYEDSKNKVVDELVYPDKLIINDFATSLEKCPATHILEYYKQDVVSKIRSGEYVDFKFDIDKKDDTTPADDYSNQEVATNQSSAGLHIFLEQHTWLDLDNDGYPEPYIVTVHQSSGTLVRLTKRFYKEDVAKNKDGQIVEIKAQQFFIKYIFIPSPDGSFYGIGLGHLLFNITESVNTSINQLNDAATLQNTGGAFVAKSLKLSGGSKTLRPGELKQVDAFGGNIRDSIVMIPTPQPSQTLFALLSYLVQAGKELAALRDVMSGENAGNVAPTTILAMVEQGYKQFKSIYKRIKRSAAQEFKMITAINSKTVTIKKYAEILGIEERNVSVKKDFQSNNYDIVLTADADSINNMEKMAKANFLMQFLNDPNIDRKLVLQKIFAITHIEDADKIIIDSPPQQNPLLEVEQIKAEIAIQKIQAEVQRSNQTHSLETQKLIMAAQKNQIEISKLNSEIEKIKSDAMVNLANIGKITKETDLKEQTEQIKVLDNQIDANIREKEIEDKKAAREQEAQLKILDMAHKGKTEIEKMRFQKEMAGIKKEQEQVITSKKSESNDTQE